VSAVVLLGAVTRQVCLRLPGAKAAERSSGGLVKSMRKAAADLNAWTQTQQDSFQAHKRNKTAFTGSGSGLDRTSHRASGFTDSVH